MREGISQFSTAERIAVIAESLVNRDLVSLCGRLGIEFPAALRPGHGSGLMSA